MRILILGGTWFLGRCVAEQALGRGWKVTVFNRGRSGRDLPGVRSVRGDRTAREDLARLADVGPWDAVVDTSASELTPSVVDEAARVLEPVAARYVYVSTVNAYKGWPNEPLTEDSPVYAEPPGQNAPAAEVYGRNKAAAERGLMKHYSTERSIVLRPGVILGPGEYVGRLPWWLLRARRGGAILAPGDPKRCIQPIDVRDVAEFALDCTIRGSGVFNVAAPRNHGTMADFVQACLEVTGGRGQIKWVCDADLLRHGVREWTELPLWRTAPGAWAVDASRARAAGMLSRPMLQTVADTWDWIARGNRPIEHPRWHDHGVSEERERAILASL